MGHSDAETKLEIAYWRKTIKEEQLVLRQYYEHAGINDPEMEMAMTFDFDSWPQFDNMEID